MLNERSLRYALRIAAVVCLAAGPAAVDGADQKLAFDGPMLNLTIGKTQIFDGGGQPARFGLEYRFPPGTAWLLIPAVGAAASDSGARFIYTDVRHDFWIGQHWVAIPSFGFGWFEVGDHLQLGSSVEFRSGLEFAYRLPHEYRVGAALFHLSNGGLAHHNPGTEVLVLSLCVPLQSVAM